MTRITSPTGRTYDAESKYFADGGGAHLFRCVDEKGRLRVYKRYKKIVTDSAEVARIARLAADGADVVRRAEGRNGRRELAGTPEASVNWPIDVIPGRVGTAGVILPLLPQSFMRVDTDGNPAMRSLDFLCLVRSVPEPPPVEVRVGVLIRVCDIFRLLEERELVHGDVSYRNLAWRQADAHAYLIDCDGLAPFHSPPVGALTTDGWRDPRFIAQNVSAHDRYSDRFALALILYRGLFLNPGGPRWPNGPTGKWVTASEFPVRLDPRLRTLFALAFREPFSTEQRPTARQWHEALVGTFIKRGGRLPAYDMDALRIVEDWADRRRQEWAREARTAAQKRKPTAPAAPASPHAQPAAATPTAQRPTRHPTTTARTTTVRATTGAGGGGGLTNPGVPTGSPRRPQPGPTPFAPGRKRRTAQLGVVLAVLAVLGGAGAVLAQWKHEDRADSSGASAPCPSAVASRIPSGSGATLLHLYTTSEHRITLCADSAGQVYYDGALLHTSNGPPMTIPAEQTDDGYEAQHGDYDYVIHGDEVTVHMPDGAEHSYTLHEESP